MKKDADEIVRVQFIHFTEDSVGRTDGGDGSAD